MKRFLVWFLILSFPAVAARAQDSATEQQIDKLSGQIQDVLAAQAAQEKRIEALEQQINNLGSQANQAGASGFASQDDLKKLAEQVQELAVSSNSNAVEPKSAKVRWRAELSALAPNE